MATIAELFIEIGTKGGTQAIGSMKGLVNSSIAAKAALIAVVGALEEISRAAVNMAVSLDKYEALTGKSADELQRLQYMAAQANVSGQELSSTIQNIQKAQTEVLLGRGNIAPFALLGISPNEDPVKVLEQLRLKINELPPATARAITSQMGISDNIFYMLSRAQNEMDKIDKRYMLNDKNRQGLLKLNTEWETFWFMLKQISAKMTSLNTTLIADVLQAIGNIVRAIADISTWLHKVISSMSDLKTALLVVGAIALVYFAPFYAALAGILLIIEDIWGYFNGYDTITGRLIDWVKSSNLLNISFEDLVEVAKTIGSYFTSVFSAIKGIVIGLIGLVKNVGLAFIKSFGNSLGLKTAKDFLSSIKDILKTIMSYIDQISFDKIFDSDTQDLIVMIGESIGNLIGWLVKMVKETLFSAKAMTFFKGALDLIIGTVKLVIGVVSALLELLVPLVKLVINFASTLGSLFSGDFKGAWKSVKEMGGNAKEMFDGIVDNKSVAKLFANTAPSMTNDNSSSNQNNTNNNHITINVSGNDNPQELAQNIVGEINDAFFQSPALGEVK